MKVSDMGLVELVDTVKCLLDRVDSLERGADQDRWMTRKEVQSLLGYNTVTVKDFENKGVLINVNKHGNPRYKKSDVDRLIKGES